MADSLTFNYTVRDPSGRKVEGTIDAANADEATGRLRDRGFAIVDLAEQKQRRGGGEISLFSGGKAARKANTAELALFTRQLATMIGAGIPLLEGFEILAEQVLDQNKGFGEGLAEVSEAVRGGTGLSDALSHFPKIFPDIYVNMIKAGEASGQLDTILNRLADYMEASESLKREIKSAMTYPVISLILILGITGYLLVGVIPKFKTMFDSLNAELPGLTVFILGLSDGVQENFTLVIGVIVGLIVGFIFAKRVRSVRRVLDIISLKMPVFGGLNQKVVVSRFSRTFSTLLSSGVPILGALEIVATTSGNLLLKKQC